MNRVNLVLAGLIVFTLGATNTWGQNISQEYEIVDNTPFRIGNDGVVSSFVTVRPLTAARFGEAGLLLRYRITKQLIASAATQFEEVRAELARRAMAPEDVEMGEWEGILEASGYKDIYLYNPDQQFDQTLRRYEAYRPKVVMSDYATTPAYKVWDAVTLVNLVATGAINTQDVEVVDLDGTEVETVRFRGPLAEKLTQVYQTRPFFEEQSPYEAGMQLVHRRVQKIQPCPP